MQSVFEFKLNILFQQLFCATPTKTYKDLRQTKNHTFFWHSEWILICGCIWKCGNNCGKSHYLICSMRFSQSGDRIVFHRVFQKAAEQNWQFALYSPHVDARTEYPSTNLNTGTGNDWLLQNMANGWLTRRSIRMNFMSACIVGDLAEMGSEIYEWFCANQRIHAHKKYICNLFRRFYSY